jgi:hypothetical protein
MFVDEAEVAAEGPVFAKARTPGAGWLAAPSRFAAWSRSRATLVLLLLAAIELAGLAAPRVQMGPSPAALADGRTAVEARDEDLILYERIIAGIRDGQDYYSVAARELRAGGYPMRPFVAFRPPLLAEALAHVSPLAGLLALRALVVAVMLAWAIKLRAATGTPAGWAIACLLLACGVSLFTQARYVTLHEIWAGLLVALSLALRTPQRWVAAAILGLLAMLVRELALPYVAIMAAAALSERKWREAAGWTAAIGLFAVATGFHAAAASAVVTVADQVSPGWTHRSHWSLFLNAIWLTGPTRSAPYLCAVALTPLALLGWAGWREPIAARAFATLTGYAAMLSFFGRPDNFYWALMITPLLLVGLAFAPRSLSELVACIRREPDLKPPARARRERSDLATPAQPHASGEARGLS